MATILMVVICIAFIGLGIPDSLFGAAWPVMRIEFGLPASTAGLITPLVTCGTIFSSLMSDRVIRRFGTGIVSTVSTALTVIGLLGFSLSHSLMWICLCCVPMGIGAGAIDSGLNNYVANHYRASHMSFLHCFYGIGVSVSPFFMSLALANGNWRQGYRTAFWVQLGILTVLMLSLPLWRRMSQRATESDASDQTAAKQPSPGLLHLAANPAVRSTWFTFFGSCGMECIAGTWGATYLVLNRGLSADRAALLVMLFYAGLASGRFLSGILSGKIPPKRILFLGLGGIAVAVTVLLIPFPQSVSAVFAGIGLFLAGLGVGPTFPNLVYLTPVHFGAELSGAVMGTQFAVSSLAFLLMPPFFSLLVRFFGASVFPYFLGGLLIFTVCSAISLFRRVKTPSNS